MHPNELLKQVAAGDSRAFRQLYDLFQSRVFNTALSYLQNQEDAEEVVQDVFVEIHANAAGFQYRSEVGTWIYRITVNRCLDALRKRQSKKRFSIITSLLHRDTGALIHDPPNFHHPGIQLELKEEAAQVFAAIRQLQASQQTAFILKYIEGLPQQQIAEIMEVTEKAVEGLLQRAKAHLRKSLEHRGKGNSEK